MALYPNVQKKAQAELGRVIGPHRLPEHSDLGNLTYIRAVVMESMRWIPVVPFGVPHSTNAEDFYDGYFIPRGSLVLPVSTRSFLFSLRCLN